MGVEGPLLGEDDGARSPLQGEFLQLEEEREGASGGGWPKGGVKFGMTKKDR